MSILYTYFGYRLLKIFYGGMYQLHIKGYSIYKFHKASNPDQKFLIYSPKKPLELLHFQTFNVQFLLVEQQ